MLSKSCGTRQRRTNVTADSIKWTTFRTLEPNPDPYSPMTQSILEQGLDTSKLVNAFRQDERIAKFHRGYLYINVNQVAQIIESILDIPREVLVQYLRDDVDVDLGEISIRPSYSGLKFIAKVSNASISTILHGLFVKRKIPERPPVAEQTNESLHSLIQTHQGFLTKSVSAHVLFSALAELYVVGIERYMPGEPSRRQIQNIISEGKQSKTSEMARWAAELTDKEDRNSFLEAFGHRCPREMEIAVPRWRDDPSTLYETTPCERRLPEKTDDSTGIITTLAGFALFPGSLLERLRENPKNEWLKSYAYLRDILVEVGERSTNQGYFAEPEDIFYVSICTARALLTEPPSRQYVRKTVAQERRKREWNRRYTPPRFADKRFHPVGQNQSTQDDGVLHGLGVSQGEVSGRVIVAESPEEVELSNDSEPRILVTKFTDAGWTPLFFQIDGLVMERGSLLSHGSIVAREAGIPAVVNASDALSRLETGDIIEVDADDGTVRLTNSSM